jgi:hypothetical protein
MIKLEPFLVAQKCAWIRRCFIKINDPWRWEFLRICGFSLNMVRVANFEKTKNPMLWGIANAFSKFQECYWRKNENFLEAPIFDNNFFFVEKPRPRAPVPGCISTRIIRRGTRDEFCIELLSIKMKSLLVDGQIVDFNRFVHSTGVPFTANEYLSLLPAATYARERYGNKAESNGKNKCFVETIFGRKSGSKKIRGYLVDKNSFKKVTELRTVKTFFELVGMEIPDPDLVGLLVSIWNYQSLPNNIRVFAFQFYNNSLATGTRLAARYRANAAVVINDKCTFCRRRNPGTNNREDFVHVFFQCPEIADVINKYVSKYHGINVQNDEKKNVLFTGTIDRVWSLDAVVGSLFNIILCFNIWQCRLEKKIPSFSTIEESALTIFDGSLNLSLYLSEIAITSQSPLCRLWRHRSGRG